MDHDALRPLIAARRAAAQRLETEIIIACERAACRSRPRRNQPSDWNETAWRRYVLAAAQTPDRLRGSLRKIYGEIDALERTALADRATSRRSPHPGKDFACQSTASCSSKSLSSATARNSSSMATRQQAPPHS